MDKDFYVYLLAGKRNGTLYIGVTSALVQRMWQHQTKAVGGFTARYGRPYRVQSRGTRVCDRGDVLRLSDAAHELRGRVARRGRRGRVWLDRS